MTPPIEFTLGVDLAQSSFHMAVARRDQHHSQWRDFAHAPFDQSAQAPDSIEFVIEWLKCLGLDPATGRIVVESTGSLSRRMADAWEDAGLPRPIVVNPCEVKTMASSLKINEKTDRNDAAALAAYGAIVAPAAQKRMSPTQRRLIEMSRAREALVRDRTRHKNRIKEFDDPLTSDIFGRAVADLDARIKELEAAIERLVLEDELLAAQVKALRKIPGVGKVTSITLSAELGDLRQYTRNQIVAKAGLNPRRHESGETVRRRPRMSKKGGERLRRVLYMCATSQFRGKGEIRDYIDRLRERKIENMKIIGAVMCKILRIARAVMVAGGEYNPDLVGART